MTRMLIKGKAAYQARLVDRLREEVQWLHPVASLFFQSVFDIEYEPLLFTCT
jgi:hypothetical protein